jgi:hydroxymethylbilane synthase
MARAAIIRLKLADVKYYTFAPDHLVPAVGQGAIGLQVRTSDATALKTASSLNHRPTFLAVTAERMLLNTLDSGCQFPVGAYATVSGKTLKITGFVGSVDGKTVLRETRSGEAEHAQEIGKELAEKLIENGALALLRQV